METTTFAMTEKQALYIESLKSQWIEKCRRENTQFPGDKRNCMRNIYVGYFFATSKLGCANQNGVTKLIDALKIQTIQRLEAMYPKAAEIAKAKTLAAVEQGKTWSEIFG